MLNTRDLLFRTPRFNLSLVKEHFINPCCFGEDLAVFLQSELAKNGFQTQVPGQEDWGWYLPVSRGSDRYYLDISGIPDEEGSVSNEGEWRIMVEKRRSIWDRLTGCNVIANDDPLFLMVQILLRAQPDFRNVRRADD
jgi:hypothetical protein